ncbi:MAG: sialate O-acetylesterase, partial [Eubacteriales bacterium]
MMITGLQNGAVLQRNTETNTCAILVHGTFSGTPLCDIGMLTQIGDDTWCLEGIGFGGPYTVTITDSKDTITFSDIYVGDVWLLVGQSNMEGAGRVREQDRKIAMKPNPAIRAYYMRDQWDAAQPQLHQLWDSPDAAHKTTFERERAHRQNSPIIVADFPPAEQVRGVGPGYFFAKTMYEKTGVPQGVLPCAVGGAPIDMWTPPYNGEENYFTAACRRIIACGSRIRGMFWYQGEGYGGDLDDYDARFEAMRGAFASLCEIDVLPSVLAQIFKCTIRSSYLSEENGRIWSRFRAHQWDMANNLPMLAAVASNDLQLDDCIHLSAASHEMLGGRAADAMLSVLTGGDGDQPQIAEISVVSDVCVPSWMQIHIRYRNIHGTLISSGFPSGFSLGDAGEYPSVSQ